MERPAIAAAMDIIGITIITMALGINTATKGGVVVELVRTPGYHCK